jgi:hypothetical protein
MWNQSVFQGKTRDGLCHRCHLRTGAGSPAKGGGSDYPQQHVPMFEFLERRLFHTRRSGPLQLREQNRFRVSRDGTVTPTLEEGLEGEILMIEDTDSRCSVGRLGRT